MMYIYLLVLSLAVISLYMHSYIQHKFLTVMTELFQTVKEQNLSINDLNCY